MSTPLLEAAHMKLKLTGTPEKIALFHWLMGKLDPDYPMAPPKLRRTPRANLLCQTCGGMVYRTPMIPPLQIKALGKQVNDLTRPAGHLKVKVLMYNLTCKGQKGGTP